MSNLVSLHRLKIGLMIAVAAVFLFASGMMAQNSLADPAVTGDDIEELFIEALHVDFVCSSRYTGQDRLAYSFPIVEILGDTQSANNGLNPCTRSERLRIMLSLNFNDLIDYRNP